MRKMVVILYGPPGSGKGTQANLVAEKFDVFHFDTGKFLEGVVHDPKRQKEKMIRKERKMFDTGILLTPSFVLREVEKHVKKLHDGGWGVVFSGSPRTLYEAKGLMPYLERLYGKKNIHIFVLEVPMADSVQRNSARVVCEICKRPLLTTYYPSKNPKYCPICAGPFYRRTLDDPETIKVRLNQYKTRTMPIFDFVMKERGYKIKYVNGRPMPYKVFAEISKYLKKKL